MSIVTRRPDPAETDSGEHPVSPPARSGVLSQPIRLRRAPRSVPAVDEALHLGGEPRVDLLPPEVRAERRGRAIRRRVGWAVPSVAVVALVAVGGAVVLNVLAQTTLAAERQASADLLAQQQRYASVREVQKQVGVAEAARQAGASTEIGWKAFLDRVAAVQPAGLTLTALTLDSASPFAVYQQSSDPLQGARVGTATIEVTGPALPDVPAWVSALQTVPGVVDAVPGSVALDEVSRLYSATVTIHIDDSLYLKRFPSKEK